MKKTLPNNLWYEWEPRMMFPLFKGVENTIDFIPQDDLNDIGAKVLKPLYFYFKNNRTLSVTAKVYSDFLTRKKIQFRGIFLDRQGQFLFQENFEGSYGPGDIFSVSINDIFRKRNVADQDAGLILVASRGRMDRWFSSPGSATVRYVGNDFVSGFRTGFFSRPLNSSAKAHFGFTGVNTQVNVNYEYDPAILLMNHSSNPAYEQVVTPTARLYDSKGQFLETSFGSINPFGIREQRVLELFPEAKDFLKNDNGWGCVVTKATGATLASVHIIRNKKTHSWAMDHSRPLQMNVVK